MLVARWRHRENGRPSSSPPALALTHRSSDDSQRQQPQEGELHRRPRDPPPPAPRAEPEAAQPSCSHRKTSHRLLTAPRVAAAARRGRCGARGSGSGYRAAHMQQRGRAVPDGGGADAPRNGTLIRSARPPPPL
eukprot:365846-Chlamydomonas_euryale.AAC.4